MKKIPIGRLSLLIIAFPVTLALFAGLYGGFGATVMMIHILNQNTITERVNLSLKLESLVNRKVNKRAAIVLKGITKGKKEKFDLKKHLIFKNYWHYSSKNFSFNVSDTNQHKLGSQTFNLGQLSNYLKKALESKKLHHLPTEFQKTDYSSQPFVFKDATSRFLIYPGINNQQTIYFGLTIDDKELEINIIKPLLNILTGSFYHVSLKNHAGKVIASTGSEDLKQLPKISSTKLTGILSNYELEIRGKDKPFELPSQNTMLLGVIGVFMVMISALGFILYLYWFGRTTESELKLKNNWILNLAHSLQGPVHSIRIAAEVLPKADSATTDKLLSLVNANTTKLEYQIRRFLQLGQVDEIRKPLIKSIFDINEVVNSIVNEVKETSHKSLEIVINSSKLTNSKISADRDAICMILSELINNAIKYSSEIPHIEIELSRNDDKLNITIQDNGIGISQDHISKVGEPFYRIEDMKMDGITGTGLGIYLTKKICKEINGTLTITSEEPDKGTTVSIELPVI